LLRAYESETLQVYIYETTYNGARIFAAQVWIRDPGRQIRKASALWGEALLAATQMSAEGAVFLVNGSGYMSPDYPNNDETYGDIEENHYTSLGSFVITDGEIFRDLGSGFTGISASAGGLLAYENADSAEVAGDNTWAFLRNCLIVKDGTVRVPEPQEPAYDHEKRVQDASRPRTVVCRIDANNYVFIIVMAQEECTGLTLHETAAFCVSYVPDIDWAFNLDGGGSTCMILQGSILAGTPRPIFDILYLTD